MNTNRLAETLAIGGWPDLMQTPVAARFCVCSRRKITDAVRNGELRPAGRHKRSLVFKKDELQRWMLGEPFEASK